MLSLSCVLPVVTLLSFTNPPLWPHGIVKCPLGVHFRNSPEVIGHPGTFCYCLTNNVSSIKGAEKREVTLAVY